MQLSGFTSYRAVVRHFIELHAEVRGYQGRLAEAAGVQKSYFSAMLANRTDLSPEAGMKLSLFWGFSKTQTDYFLELLSLDRTEFAPLKKRISERLAAMRNEAENLSERFPSRKVSAAHEAFYYSTWTVSAVHVLSGVEGFQTIPALASRLGLPAQAVSDILIKLEAAGLVRKVGSRWEMKPGHFHLPKGSPLGAMNHFNWRSQAVLDSTTPGAEGIHYTSLQSHSKADLLKIKKLLFDVLDANRKLLEPSPNEDLSCLCVDFFRIGT